MKYCSNCGSQEIVHRTPTGDNRPRYVCDSCEIIHYQNPNIICGTLPIHEDKVLLCRRAIEPRKGLWTLPAGFMENGETTQDGAARETWEEALAKIELKGLYAIFNLPQINQVYMFYRGHVIDGEFGVGEESLEVALFKEEEIPWDELAFPTITRSLKFYFEDRIKGEYPVRVEDIHSPHRGK